MKVAHLSHGGGGGAPCVLLRDVEEGTEQSSHPPAIIVHPESETVAVCLRAQRRSSLALFCMCCLVYKYSIR